MIVTLTGVDHIESGVYYNMLEHKLSEVWGRLERQPVNVRLKYLYQWYLDGRLEMSPVYQRGLVWTLEQKQLYISNLFKEKAFITPTIVEYYEKGDTDDKFEVLDGKQRLSALFEYLEDGYPVEGYVFSELIPNSQRYLLLHDIRYTRIADVRNDFAYPNLEDILEIFIEYNELGTKMDSEHLASIKGLLQSEEEEC